MSGLLVPVKLEMKSPDGSETVVAWAGVPKNVNNGNAAVQVRPRSALNSCIFSLRGDGSQILTVMEPCLFRAGWRTSLHSIVRGATNEPFSSAERGLAARVHG